ncbi:MAG: protein kinase [Isosphaeraceae bacterium]
MHEPLDDELDERFVEDLARFDQALVAGFDPAATIQPDQRTPAPAGSRSRDGLAGAQECLRLLEAIWPRSDLETRHDEPLSAAGTANDDPIQEMPRSLGRFEVIRRLGGGGGGVVFLAIDTFLGRKVALKVPRPEALITPELRKRFLREAQTAAGLDHPNLIPVHEAGEVGPICFIASAYCEGASLSTWLKGRTRLPRPSEAASLIADLADGVEHAHLRGILHRDVKPSNILLAPGPQPASGHRDSEADIDPDRLGGFVPKLTDFGLAKVAGAPDRTRTGLILGTALYMAPEQARGKTDEVGPAADIYSLGVVLYELLVGRPPFQGDSDIEVMKKVLERDPVAPRAIRPEVPKDLEAVCLRCLEKTPSRRYASAGELARDLRRFLDAEPTLARPTSIVRRASRLAYRYPGVAFVAVATVLFVASLWAASLVSSARLNTANVQLRRSLERERSIAAEASRLKSLADDRGALLQRYLEGNLVRQAHSEYEAGHLGRAQEILADLEQLPGEAEAPHTFSWNYIWGRSRRDYRVLWGHNAGVCSLTSLGSANRPALLSGASDGEVILWDPRTGKTTRRYEGLTLPVAMLAYSPDRGKLAGAAGEWGLPGELLVWDARTAKIEHHVGPFDHPVDFVAFTNDARRIVSRNWSDGGQNHEVCGWELKPDHSASRRWSLDFCDCVDVSPDGKLLAVAATSGQITLHDAQDGRLLRTLLDDDEATLDLRFTPDGKRLIAARGDRGVAIFDVSTGAVAFRLDDTMAQASHISVSPDGRILALLCRSYISVREIQSPHNERIHIPDVGSAPATIAFSPDSRWLATFGTGPAVRVWNLRDSTLFRELRLTGRGATSVRFTADGHAIAIGGDAHEIRIHSLIPSHEPPVISGHKLEAWCLAAAPDGATLASGSDDHTVVLWDLANGRKRRVLEGHKSTVTALAYTPNGNTLVSGSFDGSLRIWDLKTGECRSTLHAHVDRIRAIALSPDGRLLASAGNDRIVRVWRLDRAETVAALVGHTDLIRALAFSPDGKTLVSAGNDKSVRFWDLDQPENQTPRIHIDRNEVWCLAFSPDGSSLAAGTKSGTVTLLDPKTLQPRSLLRGHDLGIISVAFTPDGRNLATAGGDRLVRVWDPTTGQALLVLSGHAQRVNAVCFTSDGRTLASAGHDGKILIWQAENP